MPGRRVDRLLVRVQGQAASAARSTSTPGSTTMAATSSGLHPRGALLSARQPDAWQKTRCSRRYRPSIGRKPHVCESMSMGPRIRVFLDGQEDDRPPRPPAPLAGSIAFEALEGSQVSVDDVRVRPVPARPTALRRDSAATASIDWMRIGSPLEPPGADARERLVGALGPPHVPVQLAPLRPASQGHVYYGHFPGGFFVSRDGGHSWTRLQRRTRQRRHVLAGTASRRSGRPLRGHLQRHRQVGRRWRDLGGLERGHAARAVALHRGHRRG